MKNLLEDTALHGYSDHYWKVSKHFTMTGWGFELAGTPFIYRFIEIILIDL